MKDKKDNSIFLCNSAKFSNTFKGNKVQIFGGQAIANCVPQSETILVDNYVVVSNILHFGIVELEFICPISCFNLSFGMISQKNLETNNIVLKHSKNFKTSSRRNITMKINYWNKECSFYLNEIKSGSLTFQEDEVIPIVIIKRKTTCIILNPLVKYYLSPIKSIFLEKEIIFKVKEKMKVLNQEELKQYLAKSFLKNVEIKYAFGDINQEGYICNFIYAELDLQSANEIKKKF